MNGSGPLDFEATIDAKTFNAVLDEMENRLAKVSSTAEKGGKSIDEMVDVTVANIKIQKNVIRELEEQLTDLNKKINKLPYGVPAREELRKEAIAVKRELDAERNALIDLEVALKSNEATHESYVNKLRQVRNEMIALEAAGKRNTDEYEKLRAEAGSLAQSISEVYKQTVILSRADRLLQGFISMIGGLAGGFSAAQGAIGLFAGENENLQRIMVKVQSLMAITIGLQQVQQTLHKDSAFSLVTLVRLNELFAAASLKLATALGISNVAAKALMATLTLGLSIAVTGLIILFDKSISKQNQLRKQQKELTEMVADEAYKSISKIEMLSSKWKALGKDISKQTKFIKENSDEFKALGTSIHNLADAENLLIENKHQFINAQIEKAKAVAAFALSSEKVRELVINELELSKTPKQRLQTLTDPELGVKVASYWVDNEEYTKLEKEKKEITKSIEDLISISNNSQNRAEQILKSSGLSMSSTVVGILAILEQELDDLKSKLKTAITQSEVDELLKLIEKKEDEISKVLGKTVSPKNIDPLINQLKDIQHAYSLYYKWVEKYGDEAAERQFNNLLKGGDSYLEYLEGQIKKLESKPVKSTQDIENIGILLGAKDDLTGAKSKIELFNEEIKIAKTEYKELVDFISFLKSKLIEVGGFDGSELSVQKIQLLFNELNAAEKDLINTSLNTYDELKKQSDDFANRRLVVEKEYVENVKKLDRKSLGEEKYNEAVAIADKIKAAKLAAIKEEEVKSGEAYKAISGQIEGVTRVAMKGYLDQLKLQLQTLDKQSDLYKQLSQLIKETEKGLKNQTVDDINKIASGFRDASALVRVFDEDLANVVDSISNVASGIARIMAGDVVGGGLQVLTSIFTAIIDSSDRAAKKAEERQQQILGDLQERLANVNTLLERQIALIDQLSGTEKLKGYADSFRDLRKEIIGLLSQIDQIDIVEKMFRGTTNVDLDGLIRTYKEVFGSVRPDELGIGDKDIISRLINENNTTISKLYDQILNGDLSGDEVEQLKLLIEQLEQTTEQYEQLVDQYNEYLTGTTVASITESIVSGFEEGKFAAEDFADTFEDLMKKAMLQAIKMKYLEGPLQQWYETFAAYSEDGLTPEEIAALREAYYTIINSAATEAQDIQNITGSVSGLKDSLSGAIKGVSEETAGLIAGYMNSVRINQAQALVTMNSQLLELSKIEFNTRNNAYIKRIYDLLETSNNNTINSSRSVGGQ